MISTRLANALIGRNKTLLHRHKSGGPEFQLSPERIEQLQAEIEQAEHAMEAVWEEASESAYEQDDPKHPDYAERLRDDYDNHKDE